MVALSQFGFGWYWFGVAPLLMFSLVALENKSANVKGFLRIFIPAAILLIVVLNFYSNFQFSILQSAEKIRSIRAVDSNTLDCINDNILSYNPDEIISKVEFGLIIKNNSIPVQGNFESKVHPDKKTMIIIGSRMISNPYNINSMLEKTDSIYKYSICGDNFIFINKPSN
jgi:hypothetical protein